MDGVVTSEEYVNLAFVPENVDVGDALFKIRDVNVAVENGVDGVFAKIAHLDEETLNVVCEAHHIFQGAMFLCASGGH